MSVIPDCLRSVPPSSPIGDLSFSPSSGSVTYYEARVYTEGTTSPTRATQYLGLSSPYADGFIKVNIGRMLNALPAGNYDVLVAAVGPGGTAVSDHASAYAVPLQTP